MGRSYYLYLYLYLYPYTYLSLSLILGFRLACMGLACCEAQNSFHVCTTTSETDNAQVFSTSSIFSFCSAFSLDYEE